MDVRQLEHFVAVARQLSFSRAARDVQLAQSSLSVSVRQLERELGAALFERTSRRVRLTPAGAALLPPVRRILAEVESVRRIAADHAETLRGQVRLGTIQLLTWIDLPVVLSRFQRTHPDVEITLHEATVDDLLEQLRSGDLDLAYVARDGNRLPDGIVEVATDEEELVVVAGPRHPLSHDAPLRLDDLAEERFVEFEGGAGLQRVVQQVCAQAGLDRRISARTTDLELYISMLDQGMGLGVLPVRLARRHNMTIVPLAGPAPSRTVALLTRQRVMGNPAARSLLVELSGAQADLCVDQDGEPS